VTERVLDEPAPGSDPTPDEAKDDGRDESSSTDPETPAEDNASRADAEQVGGWAATRRGRIALTVFLVVVLATVLAANLPKSQLKADVVPWTQPVLSALGLDQSWGVFSPDPRMDTSEVIAHVDYRDGTTADRTIDAGRVLSEYRDYRWRKYEEQLWSGRDASTAWLPYARWLTAADTAAGHHVREVTIIRRTRESLPPGPGPDYGPWHDIVLGHVTGGSR
jgi:hypothetical protein